VAARRQRRAPAHRVAVRQGIDRARLAEPPHNQLEARAPRRSEGRHPTSSLWGQPAGADDSVLTARFVQACRGGDDDTLYYLLAVGRTLGLFRRHLTEDREVRLFHRTGWDCPGFVYNPDDSRLIVASRNADGSAHLEVYDEDGNRRGAVTDGDCVDAAPSLVPGRSRTVIYQSSGVARNVESGRLVAVGQGCIHILDYGNGRLETLLEAKHHDFVAPRMDAQGRLYAIRRPAEKPPQERAGLALKDMLLMPFRLLKAVFGYLNFFSMVYGKEPLRSAGGPRTPAIDQDLGRLWLHGRMIELSKVNNDPQYAGNLVPRSWELVRVARAGAEAEVLAQHVAGFDLRPDGRVVYTNGYDVIELDDGTRRTLCRQERVASLSVI
jgi:hypothetical protein